MKYWLAIMVLLCVTVTEAQAQSVQLGWQVVGDGARVDNCPGNCGAGCGGTPNVCGGNQYWTIEVLGQEEAVPGGRDWWEYICPTGITLWYVHIVEKRAWARWSYVGLSSDGCRAHDSICRDGNWFECWITAPVGALCTDAHTQAWGPYEDWVTGYFMTERQITNDRCRIPPPTSLDSGESMISEIFNNSSQGPKPSQQ